MKDTLEVALEILVKAAKGDRLFARSRSRGGFYIAGTGLEDTMRKLLNLLFANQEVADKLQSINMDKVIFDALKETRGMQSLQDKVEVIRNRLEENMGIK